MSLPPLLEEEERAGAWSLDKRVPLVQVRCCLSSPGTVTEGGGW